MINKSYPTIELGLTVFIPFVYLTGILISAYFSNDFHLPPFVKLALLLTSLVGVVIWLVSYINLGRSFGVMPKPRNVVKSGLYRYLRHPMYLGIAITSSSLSLLNGSRAGLYYTLLVILPLLLVRAHLEDKQIEKTLSG